MSDYKAEWGSCVAERAERMRYQRSGRKSYTIPKQRDLEEEAFQKRASIGGNNPPSFDPEAPVTGFPMVMRDIAPTRLQDGTEITSRSHLRDYQRAHQVEQVGLDYTGEEKPHWHDEYVAYRKDKRRRARAGKSTPEFKAPAKPKPKAETIAVTTRGILPVSRVRSRKNA